MSMLKCFFEIGTDQSLFEGLYISKNKALCDAYMGKYPVISISLKGVNADSYEKCTQPAETDCNGRSENAPDYHEWKQVR